MEVGRELVRGDCRFNFCVEIPSHYLSDRENPPRVCACREGRSLCLQMEFVA